MRIIDKFLNSGYYILLIFMITFLSWSFYQDTPPYAFNLYNMIGILTIIFIMMVVLIISKNTMYALPPFLSILFIINKSNMDFDIFVNNVFIYIGFSFLLLGPIIHIIRFKPKFKKGYFFLGLFLIALSYVAPLLYLPFDVRAIPISLVAFLYLGVYVFFNSTMKGHLDFLFKMLLIINLLLTAQVFFYIYQGYVLNSEVEFFYRIFQGWGRNLGWANINDMCFYIALTFPSYLYFIFKKPQTYLIWFMMLLPTLAVILSKSRGGVIGFGVVIIGVIVFFVIKGNKKHLSHGLVFLILSIVGFYLIRDIFYIWYEFFLDSFGEDLNSFSSNRIEIYKNGLMMFRSYPIFGAGWFSIQWLYPGERMYMYHSTFIQALAAMGLFGLISLLIHYFQIARYFLTNFTLEKSLFIIGYIASQTHGLIDNVQYAVPYSVIIVILLAVFESSEKKTSFELVNKRYHLLT